MHKFARKIIITGLVLFVAFMAGCGGKSVKTEYYVLKPLANDSFLVDAVANLSNSTLGIGPVTLPAYVTSRAQIITGDGANKLYMYENARWAEPLDTNAAMVLADNLGHLLNPGAIFQYPWRASVKPDFRVEMTVFALDCDKDKASLRARYRVSAARGAVIERELALEEDVAVQGAAGVVAAQNRLLNRASVMVAQSVARLAQK